MYPSVINVNALNDYFLRVEFDNGVIVKSGVWIKQQRSLIDPLLVNRL